MWRFREHTLYSVQGILLLLLALAHFLAFLAYAVIGNKHGRLVKGNQFLYMWLSLLGLWLDLQAVFVISAYRSTNRYLFWTLQWMAYGSVMCIFSVLLLIGYAYSRDGSAAVWGLTWLFPAVCSVVYAQKARRGYQVDRIMGIPEFKPRLVDSRGSALFYRLMDYAFPWITWVFGLFFGLLLVIQGLALANDHRLYKAPGKLVPVQTHNGDYWYKMHVWCFGYTEEKQSSRDPVFVLLTEFGMPSTSMMGLAQGFADAGHAACIIDRPGYGWSEPGYWDQDPTDVVKSINQALDKYPVNNPLVFVGWGEGGVWTQLYMQVADYTKVAGVVLLDTLPNQEILQTFALNKTTTLQNLRNMRSSSGGTTKAMTTVNFNKAIEAAASRNFENWRVVSPLALHRARNSGWDGFQPQSSLGMHRSRFRNNLYYQAKYFEYGGTGAKLYQALQPYVKPYTDAVLIYHHWPLRWPALLPNSGASVNGLAKRDGQAPTDPASFSHLPVVILASAKQFNSDCKVQGISDSEECTKWQAFSWFYYRQQIEYQQTLSQNAALLLCTKPVSEDKGD
ncbi:hypothetical protein EC988_004785, partial [Linderina pennispora]